MPRDDEPTDRWAFLPPIMEPDAAAHAIERGAHVVVLTCGGGRRPYEIAVDAETLRWAQARVIAPADNDRNLRRIRRKPGKSVRTVVLAEEWRDSSGARLIVYREGSPSQAGNQLPNLSPIGLG